MSHLAIEILVAIPALLLWLVMVGVVVRLFGVRMPVSPFAFVRRQDALRSLTLPQYLVVNGVLGFGFGMLVMTTLSRYLEWRYWHGAQDFLAPNKLGEMVITSLLAGVMRGLLSWMRRSTSSVQ